MNKISNQKLNIAFYGLQILAILILAIVISPIEADARIVAGGGYVTPYGSTKWNNNISPVNQYYPGYYYYEEPTVNQGYNQPTTTSNNSSTISQTTTVRNNSTGVTETNNSNEEPIRTGEDVSNLASSVILGSNSFMPSGLVQWIIFAILILLIVILVRRVLRSNEDYQSTPLKHA